MKDRDQLFIVASILTGVGLAAIVVSFVMSTVDIW